LGFDKKAAEKAIERVDTGNEPVESLIKEALKVL
jgi:Holliday junction resolvasome RuvABC DNA-binding subunit